MKRLTFCVIFAFVAITNIYAQSKEIDRDIKIKTFVPKGQWLTGGAFSYSQNTAENYKFIIMKNIEGDNYAFNVSPYLAYFFKDNMCVGLRFGYNRSMLRLDYMSLNLSDDLNFDIKDYYSLQHIYTGSIIFRNYLSLGESKRFGVFNEVRLSAGGGEGKVISGKDSDLTGTYQKIREFELGIIPGIVAFITNDVAIEASINIMGFKYKRYEQLTDQIYEGSFEKSAVNFIIDLFSINIGVSFHIPYLNPLKKRTIKPKLETSKL